MWIATGIGESRNRALWIVGTAPPVISPSREKKLAIENIHSRQFCGYTRIGRELTHGDVAILSQLRWVIGVALAADLAYAHGLDPRVGGLWGW